MAVVALALPPGTRLPDASGVLIGAGSRTLRARRTRPRVHLLFPQVGALRGRPGAGAGFCRPLRRAGRAAGRRHRTGACRRDDLARLTGVTAKPIETLVTRWGGGLPQYGTGHLERVERIENAVAEIPGLAVAGATLHGVGLPACVATADAAARRVAAHLA